jgi:ADP-ribose pyrophosphatase YjhB (NUDIX family)
MTSQELLSAVQRIHALSQTGLAYPQSDYDRERYEEIRNITLQILAEMSSVSIEHIIKLLPVESGYVTPKVDIRAVVFRGGNEILMAREKADNDRWAIPGGWADVGYSPFEVAEKEVMEETGLYVKATRLLAVFDKNKHGHPYEPWYVYKFFILCELTGGGELAEQTIETSGAAWIRFESAASLPLSTYRVTPEQLETIFGFAVEPDLPVLCD